MFLLQVSLSLSSPGNDPHLCHGRVTVPSCSSLFQCYSRLLSSSVTLLLPASFSFSAWLWSPPVSWRYYSKFHRVPLSLLVSPSLFIRYLVITCVICRLCPPCFHSLHSLKRHESLMFPSWTFCLRVLLFPWVFDLGSLRLGFLASQSCFRFTFINIDK